MTAVATKRILIRSHPDYLKLVAAFPLRPIRNDVEIDAAHAVLLPLFARTTGGKALSKGESDYLDALIMFVEQYESEHHVLGASKLKPLDALKHLMESSDMTQKDLAKLFGSDSAASHVLNGKRPISAPQAKKLAQRFKVGMGLFY